MKFDIDCYNLFIKRPPFHKITEKTFNKVLKEYDVNKTLFRRASIRILINEKLKHENDVNKT